MASPLTFPFNTLSSSSSNPARRYPFPPVYSLSSPNISSSRLVCTAQLEILATRRALLDEASPVPAVRRNISFGSFCSSKLGCVFSSSRQIGLYPNNRPKFAFTITMASRESNEPTERKLDIVMDKASRYWTRLPEPVKSFPWNKVLENFVQIILDLTVSVIRYLAAPLLVVSSLSEISYCAHERKLSLVPIPLVIGFTVAGILKETAVELSPHLKEAEVPWHLIAVGIFFTILKVPGPYYPYWGRVFIPHFANGGLIRIFWHVYHWYRRPQKDANV